MTTRMMVFTQQQQAEAAQRAILAELKRNKPSDSAARWSDTVPLKNGRFGIISPSFAAFSRSGLFSNPPGLEEQQRGRFGATIEDISPEDMA